MTKVTVRTAKRIVVNASLLPTNLPVVGGAAVAQVALAVALAVVQVDLARLAALAVEAAASPGTSMTSIGK